MTVNHKVSGSIPLEDVSFALRRFFLSPVLCKAQRCTAEGHRGAKIATSRALGLQHLFVALGLGKAGCPNELRAKFLLDQGARKAKPKVS